MIEANNKLIFLSKKKIETKNYCFDSMHSINDLLTHHRKLQMLKNRAERNVSIATRLKNVSTRQNNDINMNNIDDYSNI